MLSIFSLDVLNEIWDLVESVSDSFPTYSAISNIRNYSMFISGFHHQIMPGSLMLFK